MLSSSKYNVGKLGVGGQTKQVQTLPYAHWEFLEKFEIGKMRNTPNIGIKLFNFSSHSSVLNSKSV